MVVIEPAAHAAIIKARESSLSSEKTNFFGEMLLAAVCDIIPISLVRFLEIKS